MNENDANVLCDRAEANLNNDEYDEGKQDYLLFGRKKMVT